jgi:hypothetical protein
LDLLNVRVFMITRTGKLVRRISLAGFHEALHAFRAEHSLSAFTFSDLRKAAAAAIHRFTKLSSEFGSATR